MPEPQGPWILGIDDTWSIAYPNVAIFRRDREETVRELIDRVAGVIVEMSSYNDKNLSLNNIALTQFEMARKFLLLLIFLQKNLKTLTCKPEC